MRVIPVVEIARADDAVPLARALVDAGLPCAEITFRTAAAAQAIAAIAAAVPEHPRGRRHRGDTSLRPRRRWPPAPSFLVAPGFDPAVVELALARGVPIVPGRLHADRGGHGAEPAGLSLRQAVPRRGGSAAWRTSRRWPRRSAACASCPPAASAPDNLAAYLAVKQVIACGGSWMVKKALIAAGEFDTIRSSGRAGARDRLRRATDRGVRKGRP